MSEETTGCTDTPVTFPLTSRFHPGWPLAVPGQPLSLRCCSPNSHSGHAPWVPGEQLRLQGPGLHAHVSGKVTAQMWAFRCHLRPRT